jgi:hypothetical protein
MSYSHHTDLPTPEAEIDKGLYSHNEGSNDGATLPKGDANVAGGRVQTVRNVCLYLTPHCRWNAG